METGDEGPYIFQSCPHKVRLGNIFSIYEPFGAFGSMPLLIEFFRELELFERGLEERLKNGSLVGYRGSGELFCLNSFGVSRRKSRSSCDL